MNEQETNEETACICLSTASDPVNIEVIFFRAARIGGFRDTFLGRQIVSRPVELRAGMGSAGGSAGSSPISGSGAEPQPTSNLVPFSLKI